MNEDIGVETHIEHLQAYINEKWHKREEIDFIAVFIDDNNKQTRRKYSLDIGLPKIKQLVTVAAFRFAARYVFTIFEGNVFIDGDTKILDKPDTKIKFKSKTPQEIDSIYMILNKSYDEKYLRIWATDAIDDELGEWLEYDDNTLKQIKL